MTPRPGTKRDPQTFWPLLSSWQTQVTRGNVRLADHEREHAARLLGDHYAAGRLDHEHYTERLDATFGATTWGDLAPLFRDLPSSPAQRRPAQWPVAPVAPLAPAVRPRFPLLALLLVVIGVGMLTNGWVLLTGLGLLLFARHLWRERQRGRRFG